MDSYKENNAKLAISLNEAKQEICLLKQEIVALNRELYKERAENATLKSEMRVKEMQYQAMQMKISEYIKTQTAELTLLMTSVSSPLSNRNEPSKI